MYCHTVTTQLIFHKPHDIPMIIVKWIEKRMDNPEAQTTLSPTDRTSGCSLEALELM